MTEHIAMAAIRYNGIVYSVDRPGRHHDAMMTVWEELREMVWLTPEHQGFVTNTGRFVGREEAVKIAKASGQIVEPKYQRNQLFSEDLW